jgi:antitoxin ParD1/3/4
MPSKHSLNVSLTAHLSGFVAERVASGHFRTASEVVRAALRLLERDLTSSGSAHPDAQSKTAAATQPRVLTDRSTSKGTAALERKA